MPDIAIDAVAVHHDAGAQLRQHKHAQGQLLLVVRGTLAIITEDGWWVTPPGMAIWIPPRTMHGARYSESSSIVNLRLDGAVLASLPAACTSFATTELLRALAFEVVQTRDESRAASEAETLIARLVVLQIQQRKQAPNFFLSNGRDPRLQRATLLMREDPGSHITLDDLALRTHTSSRTLARLFVNETGMSFTRWREYLCLINAIDRLARKQSMTRVALELGYKSTSSFSTLFTRLVGMPPGRYMDHLQAQASQAGAVEGDHGAGPVGI